MYVLGTAGHVDHGKSSFLRLLTGQSPDRLPEEKKRGLTIDLGFVWMDTRTAGRVGIVDVPGHRRFVKNMVSGVALIDAFLFLVAADDGWMPQSEEHLRVLAGLGVSRGLIVVSKRDRVSGDRVTDIGNDVRTRFRAVWGREFPVFSFSAVTQAGLSEIRPAIEALVGNLPPPRPGPGARVWVDRVFVPRGLGAIATGTLREGMVRIGDELTLLPAGRKVSVKSLQSYGVGKNEVAPVSRVALQLVKVTGSEIARGQLLVAGPLPPLVLRADARVWPLSPLSDRRELSFHTGTLHRSARVIRLSDEWVRLRFPSPVPLRAHDRFVLRTPGEERTVAVGQILDPTPLTSHRRAVENYAGWRDEVGGWVAFTLRKQSFVQLARAECESSFTRSELELALGADPTVRHVGPGLFLHAEKWERGAGWAKEALLAHHRLTGMPLGEAPLLALLAARLKLPKEILSSVLTSYVVAGKLRRETKGYWEAEFRPVDSARERVRRQQIREILRQASGQPVSLKQVENALPRAKTSVWSLVQTGDLVSLPEEHFLESAAYQQIKSRVQAYLRDRGQATTSELRIYLQTSRKNAVLVLEQMDRDRLTFLKDGVRRLFR